MATVVESLFTNRQQLMEQLRLGSVKQDSDVYAQIDMALQEANLEFFRKLGVTEVDALRQLDAPADGIPKSDNEFRLMAAMVVYRLLVKISLMGILTQMFKDGSATLIQEWNEIGAFRNLSQFTLERERNQTVELLAKWWPFVTGEKSAGDPAGSFKRVASETNLELRKAGGSIWIPGTFTGFYGANAEYETVP